MMRKELLQALFVLITVCSFNDPILSQMQDRWVGGQILYGSRKFESGIYEQYLDQTHSALAKAYYTQCNWGVFFKLDSNSKRPAVGLIVRF